jgi:hypothetical protein
MVRRSDGGKNRHIVALSQAHTVKQNMGDSNKDDWAMTRANFPRPKDDDFSPEDDAFARNAPPKKDDWAMTRVKSAKNDEPKYDSFDKTSPNFSRPQNNEWSVPPKQQTNDDWDKTQANIAIPPNSIPKSSNDDWGMTQANINIPRQNSPVNLDNTMYGFSVEDVSPKAKSQTYTPEVIPQKIQETASTNDATKWIYFLAGAFSMFVFMVIFLGIIYLLFLFK